VFELFKGVINILFLFNLNKKHIEKTLFSIGMGRFNRGIKNDLKNVLKNHEERFRFFNTNTKSKTDYG
jgi:hypothetical protein